MLLAGVSSDAAQVEKLEELGCWCEDRCHDAILALSRRLDNSCSVSATERVDDRLVLPVAPAAVVVVVAVVVTVGGVIEDEQEPVDGVLERCVSGRESRSSKSRLTALPIVATVEAVAVVMLDGVDDDGGGGGGSGRPSTNERRGRKAGVGEGAIDVAAGSACPSTVMAPSPSPATPGGSTGPPSPSLSREM